MHPLCIYGCFKREGRHLSDANVEFDANIRGENPQWGVRDLEAVDEGGNRRPGCQACGHHVDMPRENYMLVLRPARARAIGSENSSGQLNLFMERKRVRLHQLNARQLTAVARLEGVLELLRQRIGDRKDLGDNTGCACCARS